MTSPDYATASIDPKTLRLSSPRLILRPLLLEDYALWHKAWSSIGPPLSVWDMEVPDDVSLSRDAYQTYVQSLHALIFADNSYFLSIFDAQTDELFGSVSLMDVSRGKFQNAYLGYSIFHHHWRKGIAFEACQAIIRFAFESLNLHRIEAGIEPDNLPSQSLARKLGLRLESLSVRRLYVRDQWRDMSLFALTREEYEGW